MLGDVLSAEEAFRIGLVGSVVSDEELAEKTMAFANRLANAPTVALGRIKEMMTKSFEYDLATALEVEAEGQSFCGKTKDHQEGVQAFFEKGSHSLKVNEKVFIKWREMLMDKEQTTAENRGLESGIHTDFRR